MMRRPLAIITAAAALWIAVACLDISSPSGNIVAITTVLTPTPSVVVSDVSRDTLGQAAALQVFALDAKGDTIRDAVVRFFAIDSTHKLRVDSITGMATGDSLSPFANVVAHVTPANGKGTIQTPLVPLPVVPQPHSMTRANDTTFLFNVLSNGSAVTDSFATTLLSPPLEVTVHGNADTLVQSYVVSYEVVKMPKSNGAGPTVVLLDRSGNDSTVAITNTSGMASRQLRIRPSAIFDANLLIGAVTDTAVVRIRVRYRGVDLTNSPDSFVVTIHAASP
jgi:hypothetical protein